MEGFAIEDEFILVRINGGKLKHNDELRLELTDGLNLKSVIKQAMKKLAKNDNYSVAKLYNKNGVMLFENDFSLIGHGDIVYLAPKGEDFNFCTILDDYELGKLLGVGGFGKVYLGKHRENNSEVAIKFTDIGDQLSSAHMIQQIYKEAESLQALQHKHIVKQYHAFIEGKQFIMIMEAAMGGELYHYVKKYDKMTEVVARNIILQVVQALLYCHSRGVVHRDLKLENVMFKHKDDEDLFVKVIDFGIAGMSAQDKVDAGTLSYMAPECLERVAATSSPAIDVWAIGVMFYAMVFGSLPFSANDEKVLVKSIKTDAVKFPRNAPITPEGKEVIKSMLQKDPTKRVELIEFVTWPYNTLENEEFEQKYDTVKAVWEEQKAKNAEEEEQKLQEQFLSQMDIKDDKPEKPSKRDRSVGKVAKKKKKTTTN